MEGSIEKFNDLDREIDEASELELADKLYSGNTDRRSEMRKEALIDFIEKEYFGFLNNIDRLRKEYDVEKIEAVLNIDIGKMQKYIDNKIPALLEKIDSIEKNKIDLIGVNSISDVLGNSITEVFKSIIWIIENYNSEDESVRNKCRNPRSARRIIIDLYSKEEGENGVASYYIDSLCRDDEKLKMELSRAGGYIEKFSEYFKEIEMGGKTSKNYPTGARKLPYFKFFSELEKEEINRESLGEELEKLDDKIINKDKIRKSDLIK